jgi:transposase
MTFIAALRHDRISAPWVFDSPINGELFTLYVKKVLASPLSRAVKGRGRHPPRRHPRQGGALLFLSPYSPDPNPIE